MSRTNAGLMAVLQDFGSTLTKQASIGDSTPDGTKPASTGARSSENTKDVKAAVPNDVDGASKNTDDGASKGPQDGIGVSHGPTGEGVPSTKSKKDDPGTSLKGAEAGPNGNGEKTASFDGDFGGLANDILAQITVVTHQHTKQAAAAAAAPTTPATPATPAPVEKQAGAAPSADAMGYLAAQFVAGIQKQASAPVAQPNLDQQLEVHAQQQLRGVLEKAATHAGYLSQYLKGREKAAMGGLGGEVNDPAALMAGGGAPGSPANIDPAAAGDPAAGGGAPGGMPPGGAPGGMPPGGDPSGGGGMPPGGGDPSGGGGIDPAVLQLAQMLTQAGVTPEEAMAAMQGGGGGAPGGAPGGGGGGAPGGGGGAPDTGAAAMAEESGSDNKDKGGKEAGSEKTANARQFAPITPGMLKMAGAIVAAVEANRKK